MIPAFMLVVLLLASCHKTDPENHPEYVGKWVALDVGDEDCDFIITIPANGYGSYGTYGDYCDSKKIGKCQIKDNKIKIGGRSFKVLNEPHAVQPMQLVTRSMDTVEVNTAMKLHWTDETLFFIGFNREFYKLL